MKPAIKICGVTRPADALAAVDLGARFLGLNFHPPSPRCLEPAAAREIAAAVRGRPGGSEVTLVGVFVNRPAAAIERVAAVVGLDLVQLHGDEGPAEVAPFGGRAIKVFRTGGEGGEPPVPRDYPQAWGFLFDIRHGTLYGGTGRSWPFRSVAALVTDRPFFVAGGIGPGNARRALAESGAWGIDVCSGVEASPGVKDRTLMEKLFREVSDA